MNMHSYMCIYIHRYTYANIGPYIYIYQCRIFIHIYTYTDKYAFIHKHIHMNIDTYIYRSICRLRSLDNYSFDVKTRDSIFMHICL